MSIASTIKEVKSQRRAREGWVLAVFLRYMHVDYMRHESMRHQRRLKGRIDALDYSERPKHWRRQRNLAHAIRSTEYKQLQHEEC